MAPKKVPTKIKVLNHNARVAGVQAVYCIELYGFEDASKAVSTLLQSRENLLESQEEKHEVNIEYVVAIAKGVSQNLEAIDKIISENLSESWRLERLAAVVRAILRAAIYELFYYKKVNESIIVSEYLNIARELNHEGEVGFLHSMLDKAIKSMQGSTK